MHFQGSLTWRSKVITWPLSAYWFPLCDVTCLKMTSLKSVASCPRELKRTQRVDKIVVDKPFRVHFSNKWRNNTPLNLVLSTCAISCFHCKRSRLQLVHIVSIATPDLGLHFNKAVVAIPMKAYLSRHNVIFHRRMSSTKPTRSLGTTSPRVWEGVW